MWRVHGLPCSELQRVEQQHCERGCWQEGTSSHFVVEHPRLCWTRGHAVNDEGCGMEVQIHGFLQTRVEQVDGGAAAIVVNGRRKSRPGPPPALRHRV